MTLAETLRSIWQQCTWQWGLYLLAAFLGINNFVFINATQGQVLSQIVGIPSKQLGDKSGTLAFCDQLVSLVAVYLWGLSSDFLGRRIVYSIGFALMGIALCVYPLLPSYGALIAVRLLFALGGGASSSMLVAVLADYAHDKVRGRLAGLVGLCSGLGALLALFVFMPMPFKFGDAAKGLRVTFLIVGLLSVIFAVLLFFFLKPIKAPEEGDSDKTEPEETESRKTFIQTAKEGILAAKDPKVLLGYVGSFLARGDTVIITLFVPLWVYKRYIELGNCNPVGGVEDPNIRDVCAEAFKRGSAISGVAQTFALVGAPLFGYLADRFSATSVVLVNAAIGCISYFVMFAADPMKSYVYVIVIFVGLSEIGLIIGNLSLVTNNDSVDKSIRGSVAGVSSACGAIGILISSKLGGALFDSWREGAPFFVLAIGHFIAAVFGVWVVFGEWKKRRAGAAASSDV